MRIEGEGMDRLRAIEREGLKTNILAFDPGDTVRSLFKKAGVLGKRPA